ncbi:MAG: MFS transporter [Anaerolineaceae bacterium]|nr:MFS transporter [Anaerolineaceae bacterium]
MENKVLRYSLFGLLYFVQGAVLSFFTALNAIYLLSFNVSMGQIGIMGLIAMIPFVIKIFLGMLSDKVNLLGLGYRKPYIILGLIIQAVCLVGVAFVNPGTHFWLYALTAFLLMMGMALYDTATDGLALDTTPKEEEGFIQGFMVGGRALGIVIISAVIGILVEAQSWQYAFWFLAIVSLIPLILVFLLKEAERTAEREFDWKAFSAFKYWPIIALGILGALYSLIINASNQIVNPYLQKLFGLGPKQLGFYTMYWGIGVVVGSLLGGKLVDKLGQKRSVFIAMIASFISILLFLVIPNTIIAIAIVVLFGFGFGYYETVYLALSMEKSDPRIAASMFSIFMAVANVGTGIGLALSGTLVDSLDYPLTFLIIAGLNLLAIPLIPAVFGKGKKRTA